MSGIFAEFRSMSCQVSRNARRHKTVERTRAEWEKERGVNSTLAGAKVELGNGSSDTSIGRDNKAYTDMVVVGEVLHPVQNLLTHSALDGASNTTLSGDKVVFGNGRFVQCRIRLLRSPRMPG